MKNTIRSNKPALTLYDGIAFCQDHLIEYERSRARQS